MILKNSLNNVFATAFFEKAVSGVKNILDYFKKRFWHGFFLKSRYYDDLFFIVRG